MPTQQFFSYIFVYLGENKLIKSPKQRLEIVFAPFLLLIIIIKSPKQSLGDLLFLLRFLLLFLFLLLLLLFFFFLSVHHELVHGRSRELQDRI